MDIYVAKTLIRKDRKTLLVKRSPNSKFFPGLWDLPGWKIVKGESPEIAAVRETKEETGLDVTLGQDPYKAEVNVKDDVIHFTIFEVKEFKGAVKLSKDHTDYKWMSHSEVESRFKIPVTVAPVVVINFGGLRCAGRGWVKSKLEIEPLSKRTLDATCKIAVDVFESKVTDEDYPPKWFEASLDFEKNKKVHDEFGVTSSRYWVAVEDKKVLGVIGIYTLSSDEKEAYWIGWFCVGKKARGKGVGKALLNFVRGKSVKDGKKYLRVYTSTDANEKRANEMYDKAGFELMKREKLDKLVTSERFRKWIKQFVYKELKL